MKVQGQAIFLILTLMLSTQPSFAAPSDATKSLPHVFVPAGSSCSFSFEDTYYNAQTATPPAQPTVGVGGNSEGPVLSLQFGTATAYNATPAVPCDGYYEVAFSIQLRNDAGTSCMDGLQSMAVWSTTTDGANPNAYGCPTRYYDGHWQGSSWQLGSYSNSPDGSHIAPYACSTFSQWSQCTWGNNGYTGGFASCCGWYSVKAYPLFSFTPNWYPQYGVYQYSLPYSGFCANSWHPEGGGYCYMRPDYDSAGAYQTNYCTQKPFFFHNVVYLHQGATVSPPYLQSLWAQEPYPQGYNSQNQACGFSVVGGKFTVTYLHP